MARRASFGQAPRVQQNITGQLVAIAREMMDREDRNIMDAWKNGGEWHGRKVTDDMVLKYWNDREKNLDEGDPLYDTYRDNIMQLQYGVAQSKMDLLHLQGKISDGEYARFFIKWAGKVPKNSEWWRTLQKNAAQLMESAKARTTQSADAAKADAFNKFSASRQDDIQLGNALTDAITQVAKETGLNITDHGDEILAYLSKDYATHPDKYRMLTDVLPRSFDGQFSHKFVANSFNGAEDAYSQIATRAHKDGYASAYASAAQGQQSLAGWGVNMHVWDAAKAYDSAYNVLNVVLSDPNASDMDRAVAGREFSAAVTKITGMPGLDVGAIEMLKADAARAVGQDAGDAPSFGAAMLGHQGVTAEMGAAFAFENEQEANMAADPASYAYAPKTQDGHYDPSGRGAVGIVAIGDIPPGAVAVAVPGMRGTARSVYIQTHDIVVDDPTGGAPQVFGSYVQYQVGGKQVTLYGYNDASGSYHWSPTSPLRDGSTVTTDDHGIMHVKPAMKPVTLDDVIARAKELFPGDLGTKIVDEITKTGGKLTPGSTVSFDSNDYDAKGRLTGSTTVVFDGSNFKVTTSASALDEKTGKMLETGKTVSNYALATSENLKAIALSPSRAAALDIPGVTFSSPLAASAASTVSMMSQSQVAALAQDPAFQAQFLSQTMATLGTQDPLDPRISTAWSAATERAIASRPGDVLPNGMTVSPTFAGSRTDLHYPGEPKNATVSDVPVISTGGLRITVPNLPAYLQAPEARAAINARGMAGLQPIIKPPAPGMKTVTKVSTAATPTATAAPATVTTGYHAIAQPGGGTKPAGSPAPAPSPSPSPSPAPGGKTKPI